MRTTQTAKTSSRADKFVLRMPDGMRDQISQLAKKSHRSMNAEILRRLEKSIDVTNPLNVNGHSMTDSILKDELSSQDITFLLQTLDGPAKQALFNLLRSIAMNKKTLSDVEM
jgi:hypothetical protein